MANIGHINHSNNKKQKIYRWGSYFFFN